MPLLDVDDVVGGVFLPKDGQANPIDTTQALAKGARSAARASSRTSRSTGILVERGRADRRARPSAGDIRGRRRRQLPPACGRASSATRSALSVPLHAAEHFYIVTEPIAGAAARPCRCCAIPDGCAYYKEDAGKLLVGWFEPVAKPWGMDGIPEIVLLRHAARGHGAHRAAPGRGHRTACRCWPTAGIQTFFNGPESFTPDDRYLLGETPEVADLFVAAGFNSIGIQSSGGAGKVLAEWIVDGASADGPVGRRRPPRACRSRRNRTLPARPHRRDARPALRHALALPAARDRARRAPLAVPRPAGGARRLLRRGRRLGARQLVRAAGRRGRNTNTATGGRTGSSTRPRSISAVRNAVGLFDQSLVRQVPRRRAATPSACSTASAPTTSPCRSAGSSTRNGSTSAAASRPTSPSRAGAATASWSSPAAATQVRDLAWLTTPHRRRRPRAVAVDVTSGLPCSA